MKTLLLLFFLLMLLSCADGERNNPLDPNGMNYIGDGHSSSSLAEHSSSSSGPLSSSVETSSSSSAVIGVYCLLETELGEFCDSSAIVYDNCDSYKNSGYAVTAVSTCEEQ